MAWIFISMITALGFGLADSFTKIASDKISPVSGVVFLHLTSGFIALAFMFLMPAIGLKTQIITTQGAVYSVIAGACMFLGASGYFFMFEKGAPLGVGVAVTMVATISVSVLIGIIFLKETHSIHQMVGLLLALVTIYLLSKG